MAANRFPWIFSLLWLAILLVMLWAGFWQLGRAEEKRKFKTALAADHSFLPKDINSWQQLNPFDKVQFAGRYHDLHFSLGNQISEGQIGHFLYTAFETTGGVWLLINRGWYSGPIEISADTEEQRISGMIASWPKPGYKMGEQHLDNTFAQVVTYLEYQPVTTLIKDRLCKRTAAKDCIILPLTVRLDADMPNGFKRVWQLPRMTAEKHQAYAIQWFTMSLVLCVVYIIFLRKTVLKKT